MGLLVSSMVEKLWARLASSKDCRILMLGLDAAGKTSILYKLRLGELVTTIPTIGFNVEHVQYKNVDFTVWDIGGQKRIRALWRHYYNNTDALIFVVDSNDGDRLGEAQEELFQLLAEDALRNAVVLVLANKQDLPQALPTHKIAERLNLAHITSHKWFVQGCCATTGDGLYEGLDWLTNTLNSRK